MSEASSMDCRVGGLRPAPYHWQKTTTQSRLSSGEMWNRCYLCPSLHRCGIFEMCEEEMPPRKTKLHKILARIGLQPNTPNKLPRAI